MFSHSETHTSQSLPSRLRDHLGRGSRLQETEIMEDQGEPVSSGHDRAVAVINSQLHKIKSVNTTVRSKDELLR